MVIAGDSPRLVTIFDLFGCQAQYIMFGTDQTLLPPMYANSNVSPCASLLFPSSPHPASNVHSKRSIVKIKSPSFRYMAPQPNRLVVVHRLGVFGYDGSRFGGLIIIFGRSYRINVINV